MAGSSCGRSSSLDGTRLRFGPCRCRRTMTGDARSCGSRPPRRRARAARRRLRALRRAIRPWPTRRRSARPMGSSPRIGQHDPGRSASAIRRATPLRGPRAVSAGRQSDGRDRLGTRKASFAPAEATRELTGMEIGGVTVFGLPAERRLGRCPGDGTRADRARRRSRSWKVLAPPAILTRAAGRRGRRGPGRSDPPRGLIAPPVSFRLVTDDRPDAEIDPPPTRLRPHAARRRPTGPVQYKGDDLDAERGPGLGCFRFQLVVLVVLIVLTPLSVGWGWPRGRARSCCSR